MLTVLFFVIPLSYFISHGVDGFLRNDVIDNFIQEYLDRVYLEKDLVHFEESPDYQQSWGFSSSSEGILESKILREHRNQALSDLGGTERLIELMELLKSDSLEEEEDNESIDEGGSLVDHFDRTIMSSNLDSNYYHYLSEIEGDGFGRQDGVGTHKLRVIFEEAGGDELLKRMRRGVRNYKFRSRIEKLGQLDSQEEAIYGSEGYITYSSGYYLARRRGRGGDGRHEPRYAIKIESPMEMVDFRELVLLGEIAVYYTRLASFKVGKGHIQEDKSVLNRGDDKYVDDLEEELEEDYSDRREYQRVKSTRHLLARGYPFCEIKCVVRDLQNRVQWTERIARFEGDQGGEGGSVRKSKVRVRIANNSWCDRLAFHNCVGFELEYMEVGVMNQRLREKVGLIEDALDSQVSHQIQKFFDRTLQDLSKGLFRPGQIGKIIVLNEILESNCFIISRNRSHGGQLLIRYEKVSRFSQNLVSLKQVLGSTRYRLQIGSGFSREYRVLSSSIHRLPTKRQGVLPDGIRAITRQKFVLDIEQVIVFVQKVLSILKDERARYKNGVFLPWYDRSTRDPLTKQDRFLNSLTSEYLTLVKLVARQRFYSKERFYRLGTPRIYSLISHYKSFDSDTYVSRFGQVVHNSDSRAFVVNTNPSYYDQARIYSVFKRNGHNTIRYLGIGAMTTSRSNLNSDQFKYLDEIHIPQAYDLERGSFEKDESQWSREARETAHSVDPAFVEISRPVRKSGEVKGNIEFDAGELVFQNNMGNFGFNIAFINYIYQSSLNLEDSLIMSPPWWMVWQSQLYSRLSLEKSIRELDDSLAGNPGELVGETNSTWLELPVNSESPDSFLDLGSFIPKEIISKEILESIIMEEVELVNPASLKFGDFSSSSVKAKDNALEIIKEKQQSFINQWRRNDVVNDPASIFFYNLFSKKQGSLYPDLGPGAPPRLHFNPCIANIFGEDSDSEWLANCNSKWIIYSALFEKFSSGANHYLGISTFLDLLGEMRSLLIVQNQAGLTDNATTDI
ncbi:signal peptide-containing protein [Cryptosporidium canis]|uniref:Signal peptide-containing protein n=1 Tax=Cryptosporidium canis TaxID=195482 RepID=A0A9D5DII5_9CRYT|nr:signal peptide-containing protein [Cryptosporidium canis]